MYIPQTREAALISSKDLLYLDAKAGPNVGCDRPIAYAWYVNASPIRSRATRCVGDLQDRIQISLELETPS